METGTSGVKRIKVLNVPVDGIKADATPQVVAELLDNGQHNQIVFLSLRGLLRARHDPELLRCLRDAALILPVSLPIVQGARFLGAGDLSLFNPFEYIIRILSVIEKAKGSVYLLGARKEILEVAEENLKGSFHEIRVVGRFYGFFPRGVEGDIVTAVKKSSPSMVLVGTGRSRPGQVDTEASQGAQSRDLAFRGQLFRDLRGQGKADVQEAARHRARSALRHRPQALAPGSRLPLPLLPRAASGLQDLQALKRMRRHGRRPYSRESSRRS